MQSAANSICNCLWVLRSIISICASNLFLVIVFYALGFYSLVGPLLFLSSLLFLLIIQDLVQKFNFMETENQFKTLRKLNLCGHKTTQIVKRSLRKSLSREDRIRSIFLGNSKRENTPNIKRTLVSYLEERNVDEDSTTGTNLIFGYKGLKTDKVVWKVLFSEKHASNKLKLESLSEENMHILKTIKEKMQENKKLEGQKLNSSLKTRSGGCKKRVRFAEVDEHCGHELKPAVKFSKRRVGKLTMLDHIPKGKKLDDLFSTEFMEETKAERGNTRTMVSRIFSKNVKIQVNTGKLWHT